MLQNDRAELSAEQEKDEEKKQQRTKRIGRVTWLPWRTVLRIARRVAKKLLLPFGGILLCTCFVLSLATGILNAIVCNGTVDRIIDAETLLSLGAEFDYIVVLGCRVYDDGRLSHMLEDRVTVGVELYEKGICNRILMSGDHEDDSYNEVDPMKDAAVSLGVPSEAVLTDPQGLSTYDSLARVASKYAGKRVVIVTQTYHLYRALYIAEGLGLEAYGVSADLRSYAGQFKRDVRESLARCKDVFYTWTKPEPAGV